MRRIAMGVLPVLSSKMLQSEDADDFVTYLEALLARTPNAIISSKDLARLMYLAGGNTLMMQDAWGKFRDTVSLRAPNYQNLITVARRRVDKNLIPKTWYRDFALLMQNNS